MLSVALFKNDTKASQNLKENKDWQNTVLVGDTTAALLKNDFQFNYA